MKTLLLKLLAGLTAIAALQVPVGYLLSDPDNVPFDRVQGALARRAETLHLGDSVLEFATRSEPKSLLEILRESVPVGSVDGPGYTPELALAVLEAALNRGYVPRRVVVSVNLRCFSEFWDQGLQYQFSELRARLRYGDVLALGLQAPLSSYQFYSRFEGYPRSEQDFQNLPIRRGDRSMGTMRDVLAQSWNQPAPEARAKAFALLYQYSLPARHRKVQALVAIADRCRSANVSLRMYVTPIDVDSGERTAGPDFRSQVAGNVDVIRRALADHGVALEDWSSLLRSDQFSYQAYPNEHLNGSGRKRLAEEVVRLLREGS